MTTTYTTERQTVGDLLVANWTDCLIVWPNDDLSAFPLNAEGAHALPEPTSDATNPARFLLLEFDYLGAEQITFDGDVQVDGILRFVVCTERGVGDAKARAMSDSLAGIFRAAETADSDGIQFLEPDPGSPGVLELDGEWFGIPLAVPFVRFQNATVS